MLRFSRYGLYAIDFFISGLERPIAIASYTPEEYAIVKKAPEQYPFNTVYLARWCRMNGLKYQVL